MWSSWMVTMPRSSRNDSLLFSSSGATCSASVTDRDRAAGERQDSLVEVLLVGLSPRAESTEVTERPRTLGILVPSAAPSHVAATCQ